MFPQYHLLLLLVLHVLHLPVTLSDAQPTDLEARIDAAVKSTLNCSLIPGLSLAVVNRTETLLVKGYGVANVSSGQPMTSDTLLPIGSTTKAFTSALLAILMDEHANLSTRFNWSTPLRSIFGDWFQLSTDLLTTETTLEDVLSHRTGVPDYFILLIAGYPHHVTRQQLVRSLRYHKAEFPFRADYIYNNHMFVLAGYVAEILENRTWEQLVRHHLLQPLGMTSTTFVNEVLMTSPDNMAVSCAWVDDRCVPVELEILDQVNVAGPAGAIVSTASDMSRWMRWHLLGGTVPPRDKGAPAGRALIDKKKLWETYAGRNTAFGRHMNSQDTWKQDGAITVEHIAYDLGWVSSFYRGRLRVWHSGSISTYKAQVWLYPEEGLGIFAALSGPQRYDTSTSFSILMQTLSDILLQSQQQQQQGHSAKDPCPIEPPDPTLNPHNAERLMDSLGDATPRPLADYVGVYTSNGFANVTISLHTSDSAANDNNNNNNSVAGNNSSARNFTTSATSSGEVLRLSLGRMLTAELGNYDCRKDQFSAHIDGQLWWFDVGVLRVHFRSLAAPGRPSTVDAVELPLQAGVGSTAPWRRTRFVRLGIDVDGQNWQETRSTCVNEAAWSSGAGRSGGGGGGRGGLAQDWMQRSSTLMLTSIVSITIIAFI